MLKNITQILSILIWLGAMCYVVFGFVDLIRWGVGKGVFSVLEYPERKAISVAFAGVAAAMSVHCGPIHVWGCRLIPLTCSVLLVVGASFSIAKGAVCFISADGNIAQLHHMTFWAIAVMLAATCWSYLQSRG